MLQSAILPRVREAPPPTHNPNGGTELQEKASNEYELLHSLTQNMYCVTLSSLTTIYHNFTFFIMYLCEDPHTLTHTLLKSKKKEKKT